MKRIYLIILTLAVAIIALGQNVQKLKYPNKTLQATSNQSHLQKAVNDVFNVSQVAIDMTGKHKPVRENYVSNSKAAINASSGKNLLDIPKSIQMQKIPQNNSRYVESAHKLSVNQLKNTNNITIYAEDFNTWPLSGWVIQSGAGSQATATGTWHQGFGSSGDTLTDFAPQVLYDNANMQNEWLVSPSVTIPTGVTAEMSFEWLCSYYWHVDPYDGADCPIVISTNGGVTWSSPIWQEDDSLAVMASGVVWPWSSFVWYTSAIDISAYAGQTIKVGFKYVGNDGAQYQIDNFEIYQAVSCIDNLVQVGTPELEPNGGLNENPVQYDPRAIGTQTNPTLITGTYFTIGDSIRDMDWFNFTLTQNTIVTGTVDVSCTDPMLFIVSDSTVYNSTTQTYDFLYFFSADINGAEMGEILTTTTLPAGDYWFIVAPNTFAGINTPNKYNATLYGTSGGTTTIGEDCSNPVVITAGSYPITGSGTGIDNFSDDYSAILTTPWGYSGPDMVYSFTPTTAGDVDVTFTCDYDNIIAVFTSCSDPANSQIAVADDNWQVPFIETASFTATAGVTYFIVNAAYDATATGDWTYSIDVSIPCVDNLIPVGSSEIEPNGGVNENPVEYDPRNVGTPVQPTLITGNYYTIGDSIRDMDWFNFTITQEMIITATVDVACTDPVIWIISDSMVYNAATQEYEFLYVFSANNNGAELGESLVTDPIPAGDYWFVVAPNTFAGINTAVNYNATLYGEATGATQYLYYEDFQSGMPSNITLYNIDGLTPAANVASYTEAWNIIENFDEVGDSVAASNSWYTPAGTANDWLVTPGIVIGSNAVLEWDIKAQDASYPDGYQVKISTTGTSVSSFTSTIYTVNAANPVWETKTINLQSLGYANQTIWIAFVNNSTDMFLLLLDDIKVFVPNATDVAIQNPEFSPLSDFSIIPLDQAGFTFSATALNAGSAALSNITFNVDVPNTSYSESAIISSLQAGATAASAITNPFTPSTPGSYDMYFSMNVSGDQVLSNNDALLSVEISDTVLARDNGVPAGGVGFSGGTGSFGNIFDIVNPTSLSSVTVYFNSAVAGEPFSFSLFQNYNYATNTVNSVPIFTSQTYTKTTAMEQAWSTFNVPITSLNAGSYLLTINQVDTSNIALGYDADTEGFLVYYSSTPDTLTTLASYGNVCLRMNFGAAAPAPNWNYTVTGSNHTILINQVIPMTIDGVPISVGDYIGVFYDSLGTLACGGYMKWEGSTNSITAWGDDSQTALDIEGFASNEVFKWKIWQASTETEFDAIATYNIADFPNEDLFLVNGISGLLSLHAVTVEIQTLNIPSGWSIFSTYIDPFEPSLDSVFAPIASQITIIKDGMGMVYWPLFGINNIGNMVIGEGYQISLQSAQNLDVVGLSVTPETTPVNLPSGWSIFGYLRQSPANIATMLAPISSQITIVKNGMGMVYWPLFGINNIGNMIPGEGYQISLQSAQVLTYPANTSNSKSAIVADNKLSHFINAEVTGNNMTIGFPYNNWDFEISSGDEIAAYNSKGELVGSTVLSNSHNALTIWGKDEGFNNNGLIRNESFKLVLWKKNTGIEYEINVVAWEAGSDTYIENGISIVKSLETNAIFTLNQNNPNPFISATQISFVAPENEIISFEVYNVLGEKVYSSNMPVSEGFNSFDFSSDNMKSGTYFYRITGNNYSATRSMSVK